MRRFLLLSATLLAGALACGGGAPEDEETASFDTASKVSPGGAVPSDAETEATEETTIGGETTAASTPEATGAPAPPGGYAVESRPAENGRLARIEYASPRTVAEAARFYDAQIHAARRVEVDIAGDNLIAYGLSSVPTIGPATTAQDIERLLDQRSEPMVVIGPWKMRRNDPLLRDLHDAGLHDQADQLLNTKSKITVIYAVSR